MVLYNHGLVLWTTGVCPVQALYYLTEMIEWVWGFILFLQGTFTVVVEQAVYVLSLFSMAVVPNWFGLLPLKMKQYVHVTHHHQIL